MNKRLLIEHVKEADQFDAELAKHCNKYALTQGYGIADYVRLRIRSIHRFHETHNKHSVY